MKEHKIPLGTQVAFTQEFAGSNGKQTRGVVVGHTLRLGGAYKCDYVVLWHEDGGRPKGCFTYTQNGCRKAYVNESALVVLKTIKAFAYRNKKDGSIKWLDCQLGTKVAKDSRLERIPEFDMEKTVE